MALLLAGGLLPGPAFSETQGNGSLTADMTYSPDPVMAGDDVTIAILLSSTVNVTLNIDYFIYAGWSNRIAAGTMQIMPGANVSLTAQWHAGAAGTWPVGINVTDNATGNMLLVYYRDVVVSGGGAGRLSADVSVNPAAAHVNDNVTVSVKLCNTGYSMLYDIHYVLYAGFGNYIASGNVPQLWPEATCQSVPGGGVNLTAYWTPAAPGAYQVGINASDSNGNASVLSFIDVTVTGAPSRGFALTVSPPSLTIRPGTIYSLTAAASYQISLAGIDSGQNARIQFPPNNSFLAGRIDIEAWIKTCNDTGPTELFVDGAYVSNLVAMAMTQMNGTYYEFFAFIWDSSNLSKGWHNLTVVGRHKEYYDTVFVYVNGTCNLSATQYPPGWTLRVEGGDFTPKFNDTLIENWALQVDCGPKNNSSMIENWPLQLDFTAAVVVTVPADAPEGTYSIILAVKDPEGRTLVEALVTVVVDNAAPVLSADLGVAAADIRLSPDPSTEGTPCTLLVTARNRGSAFGTGMIHITDVNGTSIGSGNLSLAAGAMVDLTFPWSPTAGNHTVEVTVQTLSGGNRDTLNDLATRMFFILPVAVPPPPVPRLSLFLDPEQVTVAPGGSVVVTVHILCTGAPVQGVVLRAVPSDGLRVDVELLSPPPGLRPGDNWTCQLRIRAPPSPGNSSRTGTLQVSVLGAGAAGETRSLGVSIAEMAPVRTETSLAAVGAAAAVSVVIVAALAIGGTEIGLVAFLALFLPLYSKIRKEEVLDQFTRGKIQGYITAYPGEHYNSIKAQLGITNGSLAYHLKVLEREGYVTSVRDGMYRRYYPKETPLPRRRGQFSQMQEMIIEHVREEPGITQDGLARKMKVSNQVIYYHVRNLMAAGAIRLEKDGKETHCYLNGFENSGS